MQAAPIPLDEAERLRALQQLRLLDSPPSEAYDRITQLVAQALGVPIVLVSLVDANRQWFKSRVGLDAPETPRDVSFCGHVVFDRQPLIVPDATQDERFAGNPLVTGAPHVRAYIGVPLFTRKGHVIGTLCAIDHTRRNFSAGDLQQLGNYAKILEASIQAQEIFIATDDVLKFAIAQEKRFRDTFEQAAVGMTHSTPAGRLLRVNQGIRKMLGLTESELCAVLFSNITHPEDVPKELHLMRRIQTGELDNYRLEKRLRRKGGDYVWTEVSAALTCGSPGEANYVITVIVDISGRKQVESELLAIRDTLRSQIDEKTAKLQESNQALQDQVAKVLESERVTRDAMRRLNHFHYALDQHASVAVTDLNGVITYANDRFSALSGYSREELVGRTHSIVKSGVHPPAVFEELWRTILAGDVWHGELCNRKKNGERYWVDASIVPYKDDSGQITHFVSIRIEITQRKRDQDLLSAADLKSRQINERLRQIADNMPAMIAYWDQDRVCRFANRAHYDRFGLTSAQIVGMSITDLFGVTFDDDKHRRVAAALRGERQLFDHSATTIDGRLRHWHSDYVPHFNGDTVVGFYALVVDITDRKNAEETLSRQEAMLAATSRMGEIGGWELQRDAPGPRWSDMVYRIHDLAVDQCPALSEALNYFSPDARGMVVDSIGKAFDEATPFDIVAPLITATGRSRWVRAIGEPQLVNGRVERIVGALQDVTQQKRLETELAQAQKLESIGQLSAGIAHEINTPTQFIGTNVGFLKDCISEVFAVTTRVAQLVEASRGDAVPASQLVEALKTADLDYLRDEMPRAIEQTEEGIDRIRIIVGAMKDFSHPAVDKTPVDLNRAITSTIIVASNEWKYVAEVKTDFDEALPAVSVMPGSFNQVILNMLVNAAHAVGDAVHASSGKGTISISTRRVGNWAEVRIRDTGAGIPEKIRDRIFDQFFTTKPVGKGTGQGLAIAHDVIVKKHGGTINVESEMGAGTTFIVRLPIADERPEIAAA